MQLIGRSISRVKDVKILRLYQFYSVFNVNLIKKYIKKHILMFYLILNKCDINENQLSIIVENRV